MNPIRVLLIEDNPGDARLIREMLGEIKGTDFDIECLDRLSAGLERLGNGEIDAVLLDLGLPKSQGLDSFRKLHFPAPDVPVIVLTGLGDEEVAIRALAEGAQDYLVKGQVDGNLLVRSIRYAIERQRLLTEERERQKKEAALLARISGTPQDVVRGRSFGLLPLREGHQERFDQLARLYGDILDLALEQQTHRVEHNISERLRSMADEIGFMKGSPRDVVDIYSEAMRRKSKGEMVKKIQAYMEEGRMMLLELMGYLASYYRRRAG